MRALFLCIPGRGRFEVLSPLATAMRLAGHSVRFAVPASFAPMVREAGFDVLEAGQDVATLQARLAGSSPDAATVADRAVTMFAGLYPQALLHDLLPQLGPWAPELVIHEEGEFSAPLVAALSGVPCVTVGWPVAMKPAGVIERVTAPLASLWRSHGRAMPQWGGLYAHFVDTCPVTLQSPQASVPRWMAMQPVTAPTDIRLTDADIGLQPDSRPVVHVTLGTVHTYNNAPQLLEAVLDGLAGESVQVLVTTGNALAGLDVTRHANVTARRFLPHRIVLPRCAAVVCHGGAGSTIAALAHGLPLLIIPRGGASQHRNGVHCARIGAARHLPEDQATPEAVRAAVMALLTDASYRHAAHALRDEIRRMALPEQCIAPLAELATSH